MNNGAVEIDSSIMGVQQEGKKMKVPLNSRYVLCLHMSYFFKSYDIFYRDVILVFIDFISCS